MVMFKWSDSADEQSKQAVSDALTNLPGLIPCILDYRFGSDLKMAEGNWDFGVAADFDNLNDYIEYRDHPDHRAVILEQIAPILAERAAMQLEI